MCIQNKYIYIAHQYTRCIIAGALSVCKGECRNHDACLMYFLYRMLLLHVTLKILDRTALRQQLSLARSLVRTPRAPPDSTCENVKLCFYQRRFIFYFFRSLVRCMAGWLAGWLTGGPSVCVVYICVVIESFSYCVR